MKIFICIRQFFSLSGKHRARQAGISSRIPEKINQAEYIYEKWLDRYQYGYFDDLVRCLVFCTFDSCQFKSVPHEYSSLRGLRDDLESVFDPGSFEEFIKDNAIEEQLESGLRNFYRLTCEISENEWLFETVDTDKDERWKRINKKAEEILTSMNITSGNYDFESGKTC